MVGQRFYRHLAVDKVLFGKIYVEALKVFCELREFFIL